MAHFIGYLQGGRGETSRLGTKKSGMNADIRGWNFGAKVDITHNEQEDRDEIHFTLTGGSNNSRGVPYISLRAWRDKEGNLVVEANKALESLLHD